MFSISVIDLVRLDANHAAQNYSVHARIAERTVSRILKCRIAITILFAFATATAIASLLYSGRPLQIATVATSAVALIGFVVYEMLGLEARLFAHRSFAHRLWLVSERFRSLISEVDQGTVDAQMLLQRRDELIVELHRIYESGFGVDQAGHEMDRLPALPDEKAA
jgi:hypothetical protein